MAVLQGSGAIPAVQQCFPDAVLYKLEIFHRCTSVLCDLTLPLSILVIGCLVEHEDRLHRKRQASSSLII